MHRWGLPQPGLLTLLATVGLYQAGVPVPPWNNPHQGLGWLLDANMETELLRGHNPLIELGMIRLTPKQKCILYPWTPSQPRPWAITPMPVAVISLHTHHAAFSHPKLITVSTTSVTPALNVPVWAAHLSPHPATRHPLQQAWHLSVTSTVTVEQRLHCIACSPSSQSWLLLPLPSLSQDEW